MLSGGTHVIEKATLIMFHGRIESSHKSCESGRPVRMFTGANGQGFVGSAVSGKRGNFAIPAFVDLNHVYHAEAKGFTGGVHPDIQVCNDAKSNGWRIRVISKAAA